MTLSPLDRSDSWDRPKVAAASAALSRAVDQLLSRQHEGGWWKGELETNVTIEAEDLLMRQFLGVRTERETELTARWIRSRQREDGSWANFYGGPPDLSTTTEAYVALRLAGDAPGEPHLVRAREVIHALGGLERTRVFTRIWLALFGLWPWEQLPAAPVEQILLPSWAPLNVYNFACWARQTIVPIAVLAALRPSRDLGLRVDELYGRGEEPHGRGEEPHGRGEEPHGRGEPHLHAAARSARVPAFGWAQAFELLDKVLHGVDRLGGTPLRGVALRRAEAWILDRQEAEGSWGGIQPPWVYSLMALHALGRPLDDPALQRGLKGWEPFVIEEDSPSGRVRRVEACQSPVWDTALTLVALGDAGFERSDAAVRRAVSWLLAEEVHTSGDWAVRRPAAAPGGWAFEFDNEGYPDVDDTAEVVLAMDRVGAGGSAAAARASAWVLAMQCGDGGWAAFDADNTCDVAYQLPFFDFGAVTDPPSADVTAHVVEMLGHTGAGRSPAARRGVAWLLERQEKDGSWFGRWGANYVYGTGAVVPALVAAGVEVHAPSVRRAVRWLEEHQNPDGGWGEDLRSYTDPAMRGRGTSTASQTAWALLALVAADEAGSLAARRGVHWLVATQRADGGWDEPQFTGTGFPGDFYLNYHLYRLIFPVSALARWLRRAP